MQQSLQQQVLDFNREVHAFEDERERDIKAAIDIIQSLDPKGLENYAEHLRKNLAGIMHAKSLEELDLYHDSFNDVLDSLVIDEDVLGIYDCLIHFRQVIDLTHASFDADLRQDAEIKAFKINTRLKWINLGVAEFQRNVEELRLGLQERLRLLIEEEATDAAINKLESALSKLELIKQEMEKARVLAEEMLQAKNREELDRRRLALAEQLRYVQRIGGARQGGKDLQNLFTKIGRRHVNSLYEARASYLPEPTGVKRIAADFGWMIAGAALTVVGLAVAAPVAVVGIGIAGIAYGAIDLAKSIAEPVAKHTMPTLGKRPKPEPSTLEKAKRIGKKLIPIAISALALGCGIAALAFPPLAIPLGAIGLGLAVFGGILYGAKLYKERQKSKRIAQEHARIQSEFAVHPVHVDKHVVPEPKVELSDEERKQASKTLVRAKSSEAKINMFLLGHHFDEPLSKSESELLRDRHIPDDEEQAALKHKDAKSPQMEAGQLDENKQPKPNNEDDEFKPQHKDH